MIRSRLNLLVALPAEAAPLTRLLQLRRLQPGGPLPVYLGTDIALVVSGPGDVAVKAAVDYLRGLNAESGVAWLNIGIGGHAALPLGRLTVASRVIDTACGRSWRLLTPRLEGCSRLPLHTVAAAVGDYPEPVVYDMEAAAFMAAASAHAPLARLHVAKLISDNRLHPWEAISARMVKQLFLDQAAPIVRLVTGLLKENVSSSTA